MPRVKRSLLTAEELTAHIKAIQKRANDKHYAKLKKARDEAYTGPCECCGETNWEFLARDHVHGGGSKERRAKGGGSNLFRPLLKGIKIEGIRILCHNCNFAYGRYGYCPHKGRPAAIPNSN